MGRVVQQGYLNTEETESSFASPATSMDAYQSLSGAGDLEDE